MLVVMEDIVADLADEGSQRVERYGCQCSQPVLSTSALKYQPIATDKCQYMRGAVEAVDGPLSTILTYSDGEGIIAGEDLITLRDDLIAYHDQVVSALEGDQHSINKYNEWMAAAIYASPDGCLYLH